MGFCRGQNLPPSLFAVALRNGMQYRLVYACVNSATNASTSCKSLVKIGPETSVENSLESGNCAATRPQYDDRRSFGTLAFVNALENRNFDLIGNYFCTLCTAGVDNLPHLVQLRSLEGGLLGNVVISNWMCFISIPKGATLLRRAGYTLGFTTHF